MVLNPHIAVGTILIPGSWSLQHAREPQAFSSACRSSLQQLEIPAPHWTAHAMKGTAATLMEILTGRQSWLACYRACGLSSSLVFFGSPSLSLSLSVLSLALSMPSLSPLPSLPLVWHTAPAKLADFKPCAYSSGLASAAEFAVAQHGDLGIPTSGAVGLHVSAS